MIIIHRRILIEKENKSMKKITSLVLALMLAMALASCGEKANDVEGNNENQVETENQTETETENEAETEADADAETENESEEVAVMSYEEYAAAELDSPVVIDAYVQGKQSWWEDKATVYAQDEDGAYFLYDMACSEEDYEKLEVGTAIKVTGHKTEWSGEVEIVDATFEIIEGNYVAEPIDVTELLASKELINHQNKLAAFKGMTVESISYKNEEPGDDIYLTLSKDGESYNFCVEVYLTGVESDVYKTVGELTEGDVVDVEGFLYWYEGVNPHITAIAIAE